MKPNIQQHRSTTDVAEKRFMIRSTKRRFDYKIFHGTGQKVDKSESVTDNPNMSMAEGPSISKDDKATQIILRIDVLADDIGDFLDENPINEINGNITDLDAAINRVEDYRSLYRGMHKELKTLLDHEYEAAHYKVFQQMLNTIKSYIVHAKDSRKNVRFNESTARTDEKFQKEQSFHLMVNEGYRLMKESETEFITVIDDISEEELKRRYKEIPELNRKVDNLAAKFPDMMTLCSRSDEDVNKLKILMTRYDIFVNARNDYISLIRKEFEVREVGKEKLFNEVSLNIKLGKFFGYGSGKDIYSFQREFEKLHLRTVPTRMLPDFLKNNCLGGSALTLVKHIDDIKEIWIRLKKTYGDPKIMLHHKLEELAKVDLSTRYKDAEKTIDALQKVVTTMRDLMVLSQQHGIENNLYYGDGLERIFKLLGDARVTKWISKTCDAEMTREASWRSVIEFLEKESTVLQQKLVLLGKPTLPREQRKDDHRAHLSDTKNEERESICTFCGEGGHVVTTGPGYSKVIQYFACKKFADLSPAERFKELKKKGFCFQCLLPGAPWKHKDGKCQTDFVCKDPFHNKYQMKKHVLVCEEHKHTQENKDLLDTYKSRCILKSKMPELPSYSKNISLSFHSESMLEKHHEDLESPIVDKAIYQLQTITVDGQLYTIFYDSGCGDFICRYDAVRRLGAKAYQEFAGPIELGGVGNIKTNSKHGIYTVKLPLFNCQEVMLTGVCLDEITSEFPKYPIKGKVENDIFGAYKASGGNPSDLPKLPSWSGGKIDFMLGIKYLRYHPEKIFQLLSGLTIYRSMFENAEGGRGIIGGPHKVFTHIENHFHLDIKYQSTFLANQRQLLDVSFQLDQDLSVLGYGKTSKTYLYEDIADDQKVYTSSRIKAFETVENTGSEITYRCIKCRSCKICKDCEQYDNRSIKEEVEEDLIKKSVVINLTKGLCIARLPFIHNPSIKLLPNKHKALKVYRQQIGKLSRNPKDKEDILKAEKKLQSMGYVEYTRNLSEGQQSMLKSSKAQNFIPWRIVWKDSSISTPCRPVFDASQPTDTGFSLNDTLAKGRNNLNNLQEIVIRWSSHQVGFHTDITKMYNCVALDERDWCYQRYLWDEALDPDKPPEEKIIKTLIYGVKPSGNLAEHSIRETARLSKDEYMKAYETVRKDTYVDDCMTGEQTIEKANVLADQLELVLSRGGFKLKGVAFSGKDPPECLSDDGVSVAVAGLRWYTKEDLISLNLGEMSFSKKQRGRRPPEDSSRRGIPDKLTRRHCVSKVAEVFDILGKFTPLTAIMKLDLHELVHRNLDWDDVIPDVLRPIWLSHFEMIQEIRNVKYQRTIVPPDAVDLTINTIDFADASKALVCVAIYARFKKKDGTFSCQLVLSRSRLVPDSMSLPRAELYAAVLNAHTGEAVRRSFYKNHSHAVKLTDSQITLHWITNEKRPLKLWSRNRVIEIRRFTILEDWKYISSKNNMADMGTRRKSKLNDVTQDSVWINGLNWMYGESTDFPVKSPSEIILSQEELSEVRKEVPYLKDLGNADELKRTEESDSYLTVSRKVPVEVKERYKFSRYLIDPSRHDFVTIIRIVAIVIRYINVVRERVKNKDKWKDKNLNLKKDATPFTKPQVYLSDDEIAAAKSYIFRVASAEVKQFMKKDQYQKISKEENEILRYTGRILPSNEVIVVGNMTNAMKDLKQTTFCVPLVEKHSPIAYSIISHVHWNDPVVKHAGVETMWRYVLKIAYIVEGKEIVKKLKRACERCRYLSKKTIEVSMGPISDHNLTIAPAFYVSQVDIAGAFKSYSQANKRSTIKIWLVVFCCATTSMTSIKIMEDYSATSFIQAFVRLACEVGYPKLLLIDSGSQLIKGCNSIQLNFKDLKFKLHRDARVEFELCPVGGHNMNGKVERKIREIRKSLERNLHNERISLIQWETVAAQVANSINDLPLALGNTTADFELMDLITPNRLRLGRNNDRSPVGSMILTSDHNRILEDNKKIFETWFENWLLSHVPKLVEQPKWFKNEYLKQGDVVLFLKEDKALSSSYQYGIVESVESSNDGIARKATVRYRNHSEMVDRVTYRSVRNLVVIHHVDELSISSELAEAASYAAYKLKTEIEDM